MDTQLEFIGSLTLNSFDRDTSTNIEDARFRFDNRVVGVDYVAVLSATVENLAYDFPPSAVFLYTYNSTLKSYSFTSSTGGQYTASSLAALLQAQMRSGSGNALLTVVYNTVSNRLEFATNNASTMLINTGDLARQIGMLIDDNDTTLVYPSTEQTSFTLPYPVNLPKTIYYDVRSDKLNKYARPSASSSYKAGKCLHRVQNGLGYGSLLIDKPLFPRMIKYDTQEEITDIDIRIYDHKGNLASLNNSIWCLEIGMYKMKL